MKSRLLIRAVVVVAALLVAASILVQAQPQDATAPKRARVVGTVKAIDGNTLTVTTDSASEVKVAIQSTTRLLRLPPGQTELKNASPSTITDVQVGDRILVGGTPSDDGKTFNASSAVIMKKSDVADKQQHDRDEWRKNGVGGSVKSVDAAGGAIVITTGTMSAVTTTVHVSKDTTFRRYPADSWNYDDAKPGTLDQIKTGDQLNARGKKSDDGKELSAVEVVSGTFRSIPATIVSTDANSGTIVVNDLVSRRPVTLKVGPKSQLHQIPEMFAQRIAARLKGGASGAPPAAGAGARPDGGGPPPGGPGQGGEGRPGGGFGGGQRPGGAPDFQQMLNRMPSVELSGLTKGSAVMIVATEGTPEAPSTVIVLLSGVEPILAAAAPGEASTILSPWNLSSGAIGGTGD
jgi:hypothetical protein